MNAPPANKLATVPLTEVVKRSDLSPEALAVAEGQPDVMALVASLAGAGFRVEATRIFAHALPKREAVWWACMCALHTAPAGLSEADGKARELAENWVRQQTDELRRAAMVRSQAAGFQSPEAWAGVAAFWSGDSLAPETAQVKVPPPPHLTGVAVAGAVAMASVRLKPAQRDKRLVLFLQSAQDIAAGGTGRLPVEAA